MRAMLRAIAADGSFTKSIRAGEIPFELAARIVTSGASETAKANAAAAAALEELRRTFTAGEQPRPHP